MVDALEFGRFGTMCCRPLCPYVHACSRTRARKWTETWRFLSKMEEEEEEMEVEEEEESLVEIPQMQHIDTMVDVPFVQIVQDPMQHIDKVVDVPVEQTVQGPHVQIVEKLIKIPQLQIVEHIVVFSEILQIQTVNGTRVPRAWERWLRWKDQFLLNLKLLKLWWVASNPHEPDFHRELTAVMKRFSGGVTSVEVP